jgi:tetratricopeptide (TPR) repeat protein
MLSTFERAMHFMQRHAFADAAEAFRALLDVQSADGGLRDRAEVYLALCERELARRPANPQTLEERLTAATAALNNADDKSAERLARGILGESPDHDLALYILAAVEARRGATNAALHLLAQAIEARPDIRAQARHDADFEGLRELTAFQQLIEAPQHGAGLGRQKSRRLR